MSLLPEPSPKPATYTVHVFPPDDATPASYVEHLVVGQVNVCADQLDEYVAGFEQRAHRWFDLQREAITVLGGRGTLNEYVIAFDWGHPSLSWPRTRVFADGMNVDLDACDKLIGELRDIMRSAPAWTTEEIGGRPANRGYSSDDIRPAVTTSIVATGWLKVLFSGESRKRVPVILTRLPSEATAAQVADLFDAAKPHAEQVGEWMRDLETGDGVHVRASVEMNVPSGHFSAVVAASRGLGEDQQERVFPMGATFDITKLEVPELEGPPPGKPVSERDLSAALHARYAYGRNAPQGSVRGYVAYSGAWPARGI